MAKITELINDFSGGIVKGYASSNLKNNQLEECNNLIADGVGKLSTVPEIIDKSSNDFVADLPSIKSKNIHAWSTDMHLSILTPRQTNVIVDPVITEIQEAKQARCIFFTTNMRSDVQSSFAIIDADNDMPIDAHFYDGTIGGNKDEDFVRNQLTVEQLERRIHQWNTKTREDDGSNIDNAIDEYNSDICEWNYMTHTQMNAFQKEFPTNHNNGTKFPISYDVDALQARNLLIDDTFTGRYDDVYLTAIVNTEPFVNADTADDNKDYRVLRFGIKFEYWGKKNIVLTNITGAMTGITGWRGNFQSESYGLYGINPDNPEYPDESLSFMQANERLQATMENHIPISDGYMINHIGNDDWEENEDALTMHWSNPPDEFTSFGAFSRWSYELPLVPTNQNVNYQLNITFWQDSAHTTEVSVVASFEHEIGQSAQDVRNGLFSAIDAQIDNSSSLSPFKISWYDDGNKIIFEQDANTPTPFGIKSAVATQTVRQQNVELQTGQAFDNLLAVAGEDAQVAVYRVDADEWNDWNIDLRDDESQAQNTALSFSDAEGYLRVSDKNFYINHRPKWFGYLNLNNHAYVDNQFNVDDNGDPQGGFYEDNAMPTPYTGIHDSGNLEGQWLHTIYETYSNFKYEEENPSEVIIDFPQHGEYSPHQHGIKVFAQWIDGKQQNGSDLSGFDLMDGSFGKAEIVEVWWNYVYAGGAISQPQKFKRYKNSGDEVEIKEFSMTPQVDDTEKCALGIGFALGRNLVSGDGSTGLINPRLKGIEIWGRFTDFDANNLLQLAEIDLAKGWRSEATGDWKPLHDHQYVDGDGVSHPNAWFSQSDDTHSLAETLIYTTPPAISFFHKYGIRHDIPIGFGNLGSGWKTSCVFNRRAYYGNVRLQNMDNILTYYPDGIVKSAVGMYDTVSVDNLIEATINDGDEITCLIVAGNKLLQFKKRSLTIMGVKILENGQSREVIERTIDHVGVEGDNQICKTPYGILWVSRSGIFTYDGQKLEKLTENQQGSTISKTVWENFYNERTHVGYDAYWNQVHICQDVINNPKTLIYSFNTKAFTETDKMYSSDQKTGFVNDSSGHLLWAQIGTGSNSSTGNSNNRPSFKDRNTVATAHEAPIQQQNQDTNLA